MKVDIFSTDKKYDLIYADPPWRQKKGDSKRVRVNTAGKPLDYPTLSLEEIKQHLQKVTEGGQQQVLFLWTIDKYLISAQQIAEELGFMLHARLIWDKMNGIPTAFTVRYGHEYLLYMYKGRLTPIAKDERGKIHTVFREKVRRHSQKPEVAYQIIERLYPDLTKLEMYARNTRDGWDCWGNEV